MRALTITAPAKINLVLDVLRRRPDGYHDIRTVMHTVALADRLQIRPGPPGVHLTCDQPGVPTDERNLVCQAARLLSASAGIRPAVRIHLSKRVPVAAGLGGGSSDAAAALLGLRSWWRVRISQTRLAALAARLGSDVPFFLTGGCALATGRGERIHPWPAVPGLWIALVNPGVAVPTSEVYKNLKMPLTSRKNYISLMRPAILQENPTKIGEKLYNRLEEVTAERHPVIRRIQAELVACGALAALMSGSGPTVFGLLPSRAVGRTVKARLGPRYPVVCLTRTTGARD